MVERETWATRTGSLVAAIGSAVGLGNLWQFAFKTAENGGAAFVVFYRRGRPSASGSYGNLRFP